MHFLVVRLSSIGDVVHTLPAVVALRRSYPHSRISWVVERSAATILEGNPTVDELIVIDTRRWRRQLWRSTNWREVFQAVARLRANSVDIAFDFQGLLKSGVIAAVSRGRWRLGFSNDGLREEASRFFLTHQVVIDRQAHVIEKNLRLVNSVGAHGNGHYEFPIQISAEDTTYIDKLLATHNLSQFVIINPGGGWPTKLWSTARFAQLADWLWEQLGLPSLVTYGPGEDHLAQAIVAGARTGQAHNVVTSLKQFVALTRRASLFIGGDTGPLHLAAACRTPIVGIYGPTETSRNGPFDPLDICVELKLECRPNCYRRRCPTMECMDVPVAMVAQAVEQRLLQTKLWQLKRSQNT
ncbi:MAG: glycosyltransferase family 9 protein [Acidobacteriota bacterium]